MRLAALLALLLAACAAPVPPPAPPRPLRIVSLDYCADQYVLKLVSRDRIVAVSPDATAEFSYMRAAARGLPQMRASAEDVLLLRPDLVVRSYGGGPGIGAALARAGVPMLQIGYADDLAGVRRVLVETAAELGEAARGAVLAREFDQRLGSLAVAAADRRALYVTPGGVTSGPGTLVDAMLRAGGLANFETAPGWRPLPLERLAYDRPEAVAAAFFDTRWNRPDPWSAAAHPVARERLRGLPTATLPGAWTACGGWFVLDAIEKLARVGKEGRR